ncbi:MAG: hypothetical protein M0Z73_00390 [Betaproteobacteria bacterium]|nr:hypothetical protein [Betaproteobacteria bacterium]
MHSAATRRLLVFLLVTLLINAGGWTFNREAVADAFFAGQQSSPAGLVQPSLQAGHGQGESPKAKAACTHWCHEAGHFLGLFGQAPTLTSKPVEGYFSHLSRFIPEPAPEGLFRPPRLIS